LDQYGRTVASCADGDVDLGEWLVRNGLALNWPRYSRRRYNHVNLVLFHKTDLNMSARFQQSGFRSDSKDIEDNFKPTLPTSYLTFFLVK